MAAPTPTPPPDRISVHMQSVRVRDDLWCAAKAKAEGEHESLGTVIERLLAWYVEDD